jgi:DNA polymerase III, delta subunit
MVALKAAEVDSFVARPSPERPIVLVCGPDAGLVHERAEKIIKASVDDPNDPFALVRIEGDALASDPSRWSRRRTRCRCSAAGARSGESGYA